MQSLCFLGLNFALTEALGTPFALYFDFVIEERHGFNRKSLALFVTDKLISTVVTMVIGVPTVCCVIWVVKWGGPNFYLWVSGCLLPQDEPHSIGGGGKKRWEWLSRRGRTVRQVGGRWKARRGEVGTGRS